MPDEKKADCRFIELTFLEQPTDITIGGIVTERGGFIVPGGELILGRPHGETAITKDGRVVSVPNPEE